MSNRFKEYKESLRQRKKNDYDEDLSQYSPSIGNAGASHSHPEWSFSIPSENDAEQNKKKEEDIRLNEKRKEKFASRTSE